MKFSIQPNSINWNPWIKLLYSLLHQEVATRKEMPLTETSSTFVNPTCDLRCQHDSYPTLCLSNLFSLLLSAKLMMLPHHAYTSCSPAISTLLTSCQQCSHSEGVQWDKLLVRSLWIFKEKLFTILCLIVTSIFKFSLSLFCMWKGSNHAFVYYFLARINPKALKIFNWIGE